MGARSGKQFIESLRALEPEIYLDGRRILDVTEEPVFAGPIRSVAEQYDLQLDPRYTDVCTYESPKTGDRVARSFQIPRTRDDLVTLRRSLKLRADHNFGVMGRSPDYMNAYVTMMLDAADVFGEIDPRFAENTRRYYEYVRERDLFMTHVLINPSIDRSKTSANQEDPFLHLGVVRTTEEGIIVRGAKMLGTMAPITEELVVVPFGGVAPGDDKYAVVFAIPIDAPGLKFICRETVAPPGRVEFDHPLSARFEEMDCIAIFDNVLVPWDRVMADGRDGSRDIVNRSMTLGAGVAMVTNSRALAALELLAGVATKIADTVGINSFLHVQEKLGAILWRLDGLRAMYFGAEAMASELPDGRWEPYMPALSAMHMHVQSLHRDMVEVIQILSGGNFFYTPTKADFDNEATRPLIEQYVRGRPGVGAEERVRLFKLAWDIAGDGFGQRVQQYVTYYSGDPVRLSAGYYLRADKSDLYAAVARALAGSAEALSIPVSPETIGMEPPPVPTQEMTGAYPAASQPTGR